MKFLQDKETLKKIVLSWFTVILFWGSFMCLDVKRTNAQSNKTIEEIDQFIQDKMDKSNIPGASVAITHSNEVIFSKGYGKTADNTPVTADTSFAIASLSKAFTALAVMQLVEGGKVDLDTPVVDYIPSLKFNDKRGSNITVRNLLNHTSGLTDKVYPDMTLNPQPESLETVIKRLKNVSLASEPGQEYHYNNPNYQLLARLVEVVSKEGFSDYLEHHIFSPLEMKQTFNVSRTNELNKNNKLAGGHYFLFGKPVAVDEPDWFINGPAGVVSSANDMAKWMILQLNTGKYKNKQLISSEGIKSMQTQASPTISYGMGWNIGMTDNGIKQIQHGGILWTYKSEEVLLPDQGYGVVMLFNSGLNAFVDYSSFTDGITKILTNQTPNEPFYNNQLLEIIMVVLILMTIMIGIRNMLLIKKWEEKYKRRPKWRSILYLMLRLIPVFLLIFIQQMMTFIGGGRVIGLEGIILMMPSIMIWLGIASLFNMMFVITCLVRIKRLVKQSKHVIE